MMDKPMYDTGEASMPDGAEQDWRLQEMYSLEPGLVMEELLSLSESILDARTDYNSVVAELWLTEERLKVLEAQVVQVALDSEDEEVVVRVKGSNTEERKRKALIYLAEHEAVQELRAEVGVQQRDRDEKQAAMDALLDRQKNLHSWSGMYEATVGLLATVRAPEPRTERALSYFIKEGELPLEVVSESEWLAAGVRRQALAQGYEQVSEADYKAYCESTPAEEDADEDAMRSPEVQVAIDKCMEPAGPSPMCDAEPVEPGESGGSLFFADDEPTRTVL